MPTAINVRRSSVNIPSCIRCLTTGRGCLLRAMFISHRWRIARRVRTLWLEVLEDQASHGKRTASLRIDTSSTHLVGGLSHRETDQFTSC